LQHTPVAQIPLQEGLPSAPWLHFYTEAARLAFADRNLYLADPAFVDAPAGDWMSLLDPNYLAERAKLIGLAGDTASMWTAQPGNPAPARAQTSRYAPMPDQPEYGTSHVSIVDGFGNALAMTSTIEAAFGSRQMVNADPSLAGGFLLNNELTDFSFSPSDASAKPVANRVQPGKRPRSSMSPTLVFDAATGQLIMSVGSPGGAMIIHFTAKTLYAVLNWGLLPQQAINLPNFGSLNGPTILETKRFPEATVQALKARNHQPQQVDMTSGLQAIARGQVHGQLMWLGGADPRREGVVMGD
jgi:gamma-glutamyltranspeptidase / glutathione hydrolase